jgi:phosphatidylglycerophosphate synthase
VIVRATREEAAGAALRVAGLSVLSRAIRQIARRGHSIIVATDGTTALGDDVVKRPGVGVCAVADAEEAAALATPGATVVAADVVRPSNRSLHGGIRVLDEDTRRRAEDAVFAELLRGDLGLVARHLNKPVSFRITRYLLCRLPVTPNQVTLAAAAVGAAGACAIATGHAALVVLGFFLAHVQSVLDGCDGELARVRFQQSAIGEWLDTVVDDALNLMLFAAIGIGLFRATGDAWALAAGLGAAGMMLFYNVVAYRELARQGEGGEVLKIRWWFAGGESMKGMIDAPGARTWRAKDVLLSLGRRDFFLFAWLVMAALGLFPAIAVYAFLIALASAVAAAGQVVWRLRVP